ncbi:MAG TPA: hypothetical protein VK403_14065 [Allosphingosinicella sp.]|nr:hypothetical protein [Allosphingosinicella sp.]
MANTEKQGGARAGRKPSTRRVTMIGRSAATGRFLSVAAARRAGLLDDDASEHLSFRAPKRLVDAARRESGLSSTTELGIVALTMLAEPDPVIKYLKRTRGALGEDAELDY